MDFETWEPVYAAIWADMGYDPAADEHARDALGEHVEDFDLARLDDVAGATVAVAGAADYLRGEVEMAREADVVFAASTAADTLREAGVRVDLMVTDLDKNPVTARALTLEAVPVAVHAHGDNVDAVETHVPLMASQRVLPTTQAAPAGPVRNFGGFTDGDRAAFLADHLGAAELRFPGWDLDDFSVDPEKAKKLEWAERLLYWLERRRDEEFDVLEGRRDAINASALPVD
jgi:uncharacterized Rossmann fold enzyme